MGESYTTPFNVWQRTGRLKRRETTVGSLNTGNTVGLEQHPIPEKLTLRDGDGNKVSDSDYEVDTDFSELVYTGSEPLENATIKYMTAPVSDERAQRGVEQAESHIDNHLNTTFGGLVRRIDEVYKTDNGNGTTMMFSQQPVVDVEKVELNTTKGDDSAPQWEELTQDKDWIQYGKQGIKLTSNIGRLPRTRYEIVDRQLSRSDKEIRVTYTYGHKEVPADVQNLAEIVLSTDLFIDTVFGSGIDGRDNFDPQTVRSYRDKVQSLKDEWRREFYQNFTTRIEPGTEEEVTQ